MADRPRVAVRRRGTEAHPWTAWCSSCTGEHVHLFPGVGATGVNSHIGNRTWVLAMAAGLAHLHRCHGVTGG